jgi:hypothetical protein
LNEILEHARKDGRLRYTGDKLKSQKRVDKKQ